MTQTDYTKLFMRVSNYVTNLFHVHASRQLAYHNLAHTRYVVNKALEIAAHYKMDDVALMELYVAAWFHDVGYLETTPDKHEQKSVSVMKKFAKENGLTLENISAVEQCILSTRMPRNPKTMIDKILCDADTFNLGTNDFTETNKQVFKEQLFFSSGKLTKTVYDAATKKFLEQHRFYTAYCINLLSRGKQQNIKSLPNRLIN